MRSIAPSRINFGSRRLVCVIYGNCIRRNKARQKTEAVKFAVNKSSQSNAVAAVLFASILNGQGDKPRWS
ncbi:MAG: hypothetical protein ACLRSW_05890 [Christensenellaceae bacterium]